MEPDSHRLVLIDAVIIVVVSIAICLMGNDPFFMALFVSGIIMCRMVLLARVASQEGVSISAEILFLLLCMALGAFNDWNSVCNKRIYDYTVPHSFSWPCVPIWMLIYWGMILRFIARLARWSALGPTLHPSDEVGIGGLRLYSPVVKVLAELSIIGMTRASIYRYYLDPILSWFPFLVALVLWFLSFIPTRHDLKLLGIFVIGGPAIEILYIKVGHLHHYHLDWIGGVPIWIVLWWLLAVLMWKDCAFRIEKGLRSVLMS